jgi:UDP-N-acetylglucosamine:LPS N-acetylglucosamine transferase
LDIGYYVYADIVLGYGISGYLSVGLFMSTVTRKKIMISLAGGGHLWESLSLIKKLGGRYEYCYITSKGCSVPKNALLPPGDVFYVDDVATISEHGTWQKISGSVRSLISCYKNIKQSRPDIVIGVGTALSVPMLSAARLRGVPSVFVESITRVNELSLTGIIILRLRLADRLYTQWPEIKQKYPNTIYDGTVL